MKIRFLYLFAFSVFLGGVLFAQNETSKWYFGEKVRRITVWNYISNTYYFVAGEVYETLSYIKNVKRKYHKLACVPVCCVTINVQCPPKCQNKMLPGMTPRLLLYAAKPGFGESMCPSY